MTLTCSKCSGRVFLDRAYCNYGHIEMFCIICGKRWEHHRASSIAIKINALEKRREFEKNGRSPYT